MTIRSEFQEPTSLSEAGKSRLNELAMEFSKALDAIECLCGKDGREMALVRTHMQIACYFADRAVRSRVQNQE